ncbi:MAG TPA: 1-hydroxycarotenoid 3,4-desaturase CrtD [Cyclobacteriaceae bacterium]
MNCAVIGSGIAGLATAIRLRSRGYSVDVFEGNDSPGGKLQERKEKGYRFDLGPSVFTMPQLIDELFELAGKNPRDYFTYTRLDTSFKYFFEDGKVITAYADPEKFAKEITEKTIDTEETFWRYVDDVAKKFDITNEVFSENSLHIASNYLKKKFISGILNFHKIDAFKSMHEGNAKFFKDPHLVQLFDYYASYVGSNPLVAPATLNLISHLALNIGTYIPDKGMYALIKAMVKLAEDIGVKFQYNTFVQEIITENNQVKGIKINDRVISYDRVISNMDVYFTYKKLLPHEKEPTRILNQPKSSSVIAFYWGVKGIRPMLDIHNMLFSKNETEEYTTVFEKNNISDDPSVYICITSKHITDDAPADSENWFVLITAPNDQRQNWDEIVSRTRKNVLIKIKNMLSVDVEPLIEFEDVLTPPQIKDRYSSAFGAVFGNSSNNKFAAFFRHANFSKKIKGLYFAGGSVHPGAGIPMCLNSAKIIDKVFK